MAGGAANLTQGHVVQDAARRTLPPPEWGEGPRSAGSLALQRYDLDTAISRRAGPRAELASLSAKLQAASRAGSDLEERASAAALGRALAARGTELDAATRFARRALLLAEAGLLRGQPATTHWLFCPRLARYPEVDVREKQALVIADGGHLVMAGAATSWQDLGLYLVARYAGVEEAMRTARLGMMSWHEGGQQPYAGVVIGTQTEDA